MYPRYCLMSFLKHLFIFIFLQNSIQVHCYEYCANGKEEKICMGKERRHIMCYPEQIDPRARFVKYYAMTDKFREWLLYWHNYYRNELACGGVDAKDGNLPSATRMRELEWDYELEFVASVHAKRCNMKHDQCRNTERIEISGQNLAYHRTTGPPRMALQRGQISVFNWYKEHSDCPLVTIENYKKPDGPEKIGHFTVLVNDMVGRVGCSMAFCKSFPTEEEEWNYNYITCNYDYTNIVTYPVYKTGPAQSACGDFNVGKSSNFSCLCARSY